MGDASPPPKQGGKAVVGDVFTPPVQGGHTIPNNHARNENKQSRFITIVNARGHLAKAKEVT